MRMFHYKPPTHFHNRVYMPQTSHRAKPLQAMLHARLATEAQQEDTDVTLSFQGNEY